MWICRYFVYFVVFSFLGWIYESIFCTVKNRQWENRGFLYGPIVPIYGVGASALVGVGEMINTYVGSYTWWQIFLIGYVGSIVLEYSTSWILEKLFHAYWWDYSNIPFNLNGRICLPCSIGFGVAAIIVTYWIAPFITNFVDRISPNAMEVVALLFMALIAADTTLTISALTNFERNVIAMEEALNAHMEAFVVSVQEKTQAAGNLISEEKERFSRENLDRTISSMGGFNHSAVRRIKGFKNSRIERGTLDNVYDAIKKYVPKRKTKEVETINE